MTGLLELLFLICGKKLLNRNSFRIYDSPGKILSSPQKSSWWVMLKVRALLYLERGSQPCSVFIYSLLPSQYSQPACWVSWNPNETISKCLCFDHPAPRATALFPPRPWRRAIRSELRCCDSLCTPCTASTMPRKKTSAGCWGPAAAAASLTPVPGGTQSKLQLYLHPSKRAYYAEPPPPRGTWWK